jgi:adenine-specific DNA-methyltransferase
VVLSTINKRNGSNNLPNLKLDDENWKVRLIEEEFMKHMWDVEGK